MKVKKNNRFLGVAIATVVVIIIILIAIVILYYTASGRIGSSFMSVSDKLEDDNQSLLDVTHYTISVDLIPEDETINGEVEIILDMANYEDDNIVLDFYDNFDITSVKFNDQPVGYEYEDNKILINDPVSNGQVNRIRIKYSGTPQSLGFGSFNFETYDKKSFVYSLNEPVFAPTWFPCNDKTTDKATLDISITNDSDMVSVSNGRLTGIETNGGRRTYSYSTDYPISTYLIAIYSADYTRFGDKYISLDGRDTMSINYYVTPDKLEEAKTDFAVHPEALKILSALFGEYPFIDDGYGVAQFMWQMGAMEHQTITGIGTNFISGHKFHTSMLVHEAAHHWWGDAVTPKTWKDVWLNEGFATYSEALYWEKKTGKRSLQSTMSGFFDSFDQGSLYDPGMNIFSRLVYEKGAWVLHMLRHEIGDSVFLRTMRNYYEKYKYKNASTDDFIAVCEYESGRELNYFFDQWVFNGVGIPEVEYKVLIDDELVQLHLTQVQKDETIYNMLLDVEIILKDQSSEIVPVRFSTRDTLIKLAVNSKPEQVVLDPDGWLLASIFEVGSEK